MAVPVISNINQPRRNKRNAGIQGNDSSKALLFLAVACVWPLCLMALLASSAPHVHSDHLPNEARSLPHKENIRLKFRDVLDRVDIMGYGPTHPRVAVVLVGDDRDNLVSSLESIFGYTDLNRIFVVCVVVDGQEEDAELVKELEKIDSGTIPHWHGLRPDLHSPGQKNDDSDDDPHGKKVHVIFNREKVGLTQSRKDAIEFITLLEHQHEKNGLKSEEEDIILLLLQNGAQLTSRRWLGPVTEALIVPPPILGKGDTMVSLKLANAVSFNLEGPGKRTSFDTTFTPVISEASAEQINLSNGVSYPSPALNGAAVAMRLHTYTNLPMQDMTMEDTWTANLDLALNLWLCADGIDMLKDVEITAFNQEPAAPLPPDMAARFAAAWMDDVTQRKFYNAYIKTYKEVTYLEWQTYQAKALTAPGFTRDLARKCRSFSWYAENVNTDLNELLSTTEEIQRRDTVVERPFEQKSDEKFEQKEEVKPEVESKPIEAESKKLESIPEKEVAKSKKSESKPKKEVAKSKKLESKPEKEVARSRKLDSKPTEEKAKSRKLESKAEIEATKSKKSESKSEKEVTIPEDKKSVPVQHSLADLVLQARENNERHKDDAALPNKPIEIEEQEKEDKINNPDLPDRPLPVPRDDGGENPDVVIPARSDKLKPSKPLCDECLAIVQKAQPIDITYEDVKKLSPNEHPHMGATDENGEVGYIHDVTSLRKNPPTFNFTGEKLKNACEKRDNNWRMLNEKVFVDLKYDKEMEESGKPRAKIFCLVYTTSASHGRIPGIRETWGPKCDGFLVGSNETDRSIDAVNILHEGEEAYGNIWQKVRSMWAYIYDNYYEDYDWFHIGGDDLFLIPENLRYYLESEEIRTAGNGGLYLPDGTEKMQTPLYLGRRFAYMGDMNDIFNSGGSGYTMNKAALKTLVARGFPEFFPHTHTFSEDTMVSRVFRNFGVYPYETKDEKGGERYMPFMPGHHYGYRLPEDHDQDWYAKYSINIKEGVDHCSERSVAFHYVKDDAMKRLYALLYHLCPTEEE